MMRETPKAQFVTGTLRGVAPFFNPVGAAYGVGKPSVGLLKKGGVGFFVLGNKDFVLVQKECQDPDRVFKL